MYIDTGIHQGPLCPMSGGKSERHRRIVEIENEVYDNLAEHRDKDGEYVSREWERAANEQTDNLIQAEFPDIFVTSHHDLDWMLLYRHTAVPVSPHAVKLGGYIDTWYWQCPACHFVLPATVQSRGI